MADDISVSNKASGNGESIRVLIADDHTLFREGLCRLLESEKDMHCIAVANDGEQAIKLAKEYTPDVADVGGIMYGPVLLGGENIHSLTSLDLDLSNLEGSFDQDEEDVLHFISNDVSFVPFYRIHGIPYSVYFKIHSSK